MKNKYLLGFLLVLFSVHYSNAQNCPYSIGNSSTTARPHFKISSGTCNDYPSKITIDGSSFMKGACNGTNLFYDLDNGETEPSSSDTFSADFGFGICDYVNGELQTLSNEEFSKEDKPIIYPNPTSRSEFLNIRLNDRPNASILIYDLSGKMIMKEGMNNNSFKQLDISKLHSGVYLLKIIADGISANRKIVVTN